MRLAQIPHWRSHPRIIIGAFAALLLVAALLHFTAPFADSSKDDEANLSSQKAKTYPSNGATQFRMASFNLLGAGHTRPGGDRPGWAGGKKRMTWAVQIIRDQNLDLIGFQEMQAPQFSKFKQITGDEYGVYPGDQEGPAAMHNSIAWRKDTWQQVELNWIHIPYFYGDKIRMPYILLRNLKTGQLAWFANFHNPANARGNAAKWRRQATNLQIRLVNRLREENPGIPVHFTGDFNDREKYFCPLVRRTEMEAANGGYVTRSGACHPPKPMWVDWIFATGPTSLTDHQAFRSALVRKTTDHPVIISNASIPPAKAQAANIKRVLVLSVEGLHPGALNRFGAEVAPGIHSLIRDGSSTLNARTIYRRTNQLPNAMSMLTGRSETAKFGGHGQLSENDRGRTLHQTAGSYMSSVFDVAHNSGRSTSLFAQDPDMAMVRRTWSAKYGGADPVGRNNGRNKISSYTMNTASRKLVRDVRRQLADRPRRFTFVQLTDLDSAGHRFRFGSKRYGVALTKLDRKIRKILKTVKSTPKLKDSTLVVLTSEHAGRRRAHKRQDKLGNYRVPFIVWGPDVPADMDLYDMNPMFANPGRGRPGYGGTPPIRNADVANLALAALGLPSTSGSNINHGQTLNIFGGP